MTKIKFFYPEVYEIARYKKTRKEYPPFGVLYLAAVLEREGYYVELEKICSESDSFDLREFNVVMYSLSSSVGSDIYSRWKFFYNDEGIYGSSTRPGWGWRNRRDA